MTETDTALERRTQDTQLRAEPYRTESSHFTHWSAGCGVVTHNDTAKIGVHKLAERLYAEVVVLEASVRFDCAAIEHRGIYDQPESAAIPDAAKASSIFHLLLQHVE
jgi:hypothetical protein